MLTKVVRGIGCGLKRTEMSKYLDKKMNPNFFLSEFFLRPPVSARILSSPGGLLNTHSNYSALSSLIHSIIGAFRVQPLQYSVVLLGLT